MTIIKTAIITLLAIFILSASASTSVYITETGSKYHRGSCSYLKSSKIEITLKDAIDRGLAACKRCKPPKSYQ